ncbi:hypothetical protein [Nonomuraea mesophila]|uniref:hypothetical protein n=1 Tax=Nonomuraea mesophila TaxID=2530382 RepID=UPI00140BE5C9|nr:hypothetical protein [Nonomuraea mesophila]
MLPLVPDRPRRRITALDALRGFALCGIIFIIGYLRGDPRFQDSVAQFGAPSSH